jgi:hypothetical protein
LNDDEIESAGRIHGILVTRIIRTPGLFAPRIFRHTSKGGLFAPRIFRHTSKGGLFAPRIFRHTSKGGLFAPRGFFVTLSV